MVCFRSLIHIDLSLKSFIYFIQISQLQFADNGLRGSNMQLWQPKCAHRLATTATCCLPPIHRPAGYNHAIFMHSAISIIEIAGVSPPLFFNCVHCLCFESYQACQLCQIVIFDRRFLVSCCFSQNMLVFKNHSQLKVNQCIICISHWQGVDKLPCLFPWFVSIIRIFWFFHTISTCFWWIFWFSQPTVNLM